MYLVCTGARARVPMLRLQSCCAVEQSARKIGAFHHDNWMDLRPSQPPEAASTPLLVAECGEKRRSSALRCFAGRLLDRSARFICAELCW